MNYSLAEAAKLTKLSKRQVRYYAEQLQLERPQDARGHNQYTPENLKAIQTYLEDPKPVALPSAPPSSLQRAIESLQDLNIPPVSRPPALIRVTITLRPGVIIDKTLSESQLPRLLDILAD